LFRFGLGCYPKFIIFMKNSLRSRENPGIEKKIRKSNIILIKREEKKNL